MQVGDEVQRSARYWKTAHQWKGKIVRIEGEKFYVDFERWSENPWTGQVERDKPMPYNAEELDPV